VVNAQLVHELSDRLFVVREGRAKIDIEAAIVVESDDLQAVADSVSDQSLKQYLIPISIEPLSALTHGNHRRHGELRDVLKVSIVCDEGVNGDALGFKEALSQIVRYLRVREQHRRGRIDENVTRSAVMPF